MEQCIYCCPGGPTSDEAIAMGYKVCPKCREQIDKTNNRNRRMKEQIASARSEEARLFGECEMI